MREILFRGKTITSKEWIYGDLLQYAGGTQIWENTEQGKFNAQIIPETVGQYTGLKDKNGNEIFEGDILEGDLEDNLDPGAKWRSVVIWGKFRWMCKGRQTLPMDEYDILEGEVVGNIHDNPELLKRK